MEHIEHVNDPDKPLLGRLPRDFIRAFDRLRSQYLAAANSFPPLQLLAVAARDDAVQMLDGPPSSLWRGEQPVVWSLEVDLGEWRYRFILWGGDEGVKRFERLLATTDRCLQQLSPGALNTLFGYHPKLFVEPDVFSASAYRSGLSPTQIASRPPPRSQLNSCA